LTPKISAGYGPGCKSVFHGLFQLIFVYQLLLRQFIKILFKQIDPPIKGKQVLGWKPSLKYANCCFGIADIWNLTFYCKI